MFVKCIIKQHFENVSFGWLKTVFLFYRYIHQELELIRLTRAKPESTIALQKSRASNLIVLVKTNLYSLFLQNYLKKRGISIVFLGKTLPCRITRRYSISIDEQIYNEQRSQSDCRIYNSIYVFTKTVWKTGK